MERTIKKFTLQELSDELHTDIESTLELLTKWKIRPEISFFDSTPKYVVRDVQLEILNLELDPFYQLIVNS